MRGDGLWPKDYAVLQCAGPVKALLSFRIRPLGPCPAHLPPDAQLAVALFVRIPLLYGRCAKNPAYNIQSTIHIYKALLIKEEIRPVIPHRRSSIQQGLEGRSQVRSKLGRPPSAASRPDPYRATRGRHTPSRTLSCAIIAADAPKSGAAV